MNKINTILLFVLISFSIDKTTPDIENAVSINEKEIKCHEGVITYEIKNLNYKNYFVLIKSNYVSSRSSYSLFTEQSVELPFDTNIYSDYFYKVNNYKKLYLVVDNYINYCLSFLFSDSNSITLKENEEFFHPVIDFPTIAFKITNILNKYVVLYLNNIKSNYYITINKEEKKYLSSSSIGYISNAADSDIKLDIIDKGTIQSLKYQSFPLTNISEDTFICSEDSNFKMVYFIKRDILKDYMYIQFSNSNTEFYSNNELQKGLSFGKYYYSSDNFIILLKAKGCFQVLYLDNTIKINQTVSYKILNSEEFKFNVPYPDKDQSLNLSIYSEENNFIKEVNIDTKKENFEIKKENNKYIYNYFKDYKDNHFNEHGYEFKIKFNTNNKNYITVGFDINYGTVEDEQKKIAMIILFSILGFFGLIAFLYWGLPFLIKCFCNIRKEIKEKNENERIYDLYDLISKDYTLIEKSCLVCCKVDKIYTIEKLNLNNTENELMTTLNNGIIDNDNNSNDNDFNNNKESIDISYDINHLKFQDFLSYVTPTECNHFYHEKCKQKSCYFCKNFITLKNMQKFGLFFSKNLFKYLVKSEVVKLTILNILKDKFFSLVEKDWKIIAYKKEKLMRIKKIIEKYNDNINLFKDKEKNYLRFYDLKITADLDKVEKDLDEEIEQKKEEKERKKRIIYTNNNYSDDEDDDDYYYNRKNNYSNNNFKTESDSEKNKRIILKVCVYCRKNCGICGSNIDFVNKIEGHECSSSKSISAHKKCIIDIQKCYMCGKQGHKNAYNICYRCRGVILGRDNSKNKEKINCCYYCHKHF